MTAEQWQIWRFLQLEEAVPSGLVQLGDQPDALIQAGDVFLGIEHTRILRPRSPGVDLRAFERITDDIAARAQERFQSRRPEVLQVSISFDDRVRLTNAHRSEIADALAEVVGAFVPPVGGDWRLEAWRFKLKGRAFPSAVESVWIAHRPQWGPSHWGVARSAVVPELSAGIVQGHIDQKEGKLGAYRTRCSEAWLLLVVEGFSPAGHWDLERFPFNHPFSFTFDRAFLYHQFMAETWELKGGG